MPMITSRSVQLPAIRIEHELHERLSAIASKQGRTLSDVARSFIRDQVHAHQEPESVALAVIEAELTAALISPLVDLARVETMAKALPENYAGRARAMARAIQSGPVVPGGKGTSYLDAVRLLHSLGIPLPPDAAWLAFGEHLPTSKDHPRAEAMARLLHSLGGGGMEKLRYASKRYRPNLSRTAFWDELSP